jgi:hypothetical protein
LGQEDLKKSFRIFIQFKRFVGALKSGSPAARLSMLTKSVGFFCRLIDKMIYRSVPISEAIKGKIPPCLMIVSPPRSGSTIVYQVLVRAITCVYISNLHSLFPNYASTYLIRNKLFGKNIDNLHNYYGHTSSIYDVNEGNEIIESIFADSLEQEIIRERFSKFAGVMQSTNQRPLIFKNVRAYPHLANLHKAVPEITFLRIKRDPEQIIRSVLRAYHELGAFHPIPKALVNWEIDDPIKFAVYQIIEIEKEINIQKKQIDPARWIEWRYEDFCSKPLSMIKELVINHLKLDLKDICIDAIPKLKVSNRVKVKADEDVRISLLLQKNF